MSQYRLESARVCTIIIIYTHLAIKASKRRDNCTLGNLISSISLVVNNSILDVSNNFINTRLTVKSRDWMFLSDNEQTSKPYSKIGIHLWRISCRIPLQMPDDQFLQIFRLLLGKRSYCTSLLIVSSFHFELEFVWHNCDMQINVYLLTYFLTRFLWRVLTGAGDVLRPQGSRLHLHSPRAQVARWYHTRVAQERERGEEKATSR